MRLHVLGALDLRGPGGDEMRAVLVQPKRLALLAYLALANPSRLRRRDSLIALFWPEAEVEQARRSLRQGLHFLRQSLGADVLVTRGAEEVGIESDVLWCDAREFERTLDAARPDDALSLYRGDLLEGFHVTGVAPEFEQWLDDERSRLRSRAATAAASLRDVAERSANLPLAVQHARDALRLDSASEGALRRLMTLLDRSGDRAAAIRSYDEFIRRLASELETTPSPETAGLAERLRQERPRASGGEEAPAPHMARAAPNADYTKPVETIVPRPRRRRAMTAVIAVAGLLLTSVAAYLSWWTRDEQAMVPVYRQLTFNGNVLLSAISPDGNSIAYITGRRYMVPRPDTAVLFVQDVRGGPALEIAKLDGSAFSMSWFPDGASVVVNTLKGVRRFSRLGGAPERLPGTVVSAISPDGARSASRYMKDRVLVLDLRSSDTTSVHIPGDPKSVFGIAWSPRGDRLAVVIPSSVNSSLWTFSVDGRDSALTLPPTLGRVDSWTWAASGDAIYYVVKEQLWRVDVDVSTGARSGPPRLLLSNLPIYAHDVRNVISVSATGDRLAYNKVAGYGNVWLADAKALEQQGEPAMTRQVTAGTSLKEGFAISPDGQRVAFAELAGDGGTDIYMKQVSSDSVHRLTFTGAVSAGPVWSPTGASIGFLTTVDGRNRVAVVDTGAGHAPRIFDHEAGNQIAWSPDGRVVYQVPGNRNFSFLDLTNGARKLLVLNDSVGHMFSPVFSPDGRQVAVRWNRGEDSGIWIVAADGSSQRRLPGSSLVDNARVWARDGRHVFVEGADGMLRSVSVVNGAATKVAQLPTGSDCQPVESPNGALELFCMRGESTYDVWIVDHFDPRVRVRRK